MQVRDTTRRGYLRVNVSDPRAAPLLQRHLIEQGFPASDPRGGELDVLFPGTLGIFAAAVELDVWCAANAGIHVTFSPGAES